MYTKYIIMNSMLAAFFMYSSTASGQCTGSPIPNNAVVITNTGTSFNSGETLWVCAGVSWGVYGDNNTIYTEAGASVTLTGNNNTIYFKVGGTCSASSGTDHVYWETNANVSGQWGVVTMCNEVTYDLTNAPTNGCLTGIANPRTDNLLLFPNPADESLTVKNLPASGGTIVITDHLGRQVANRPFSGSSLQNMQVSTADLPQGLYVVQLHSEQQVTSYRLVVAH